MLSSDEIQKILQQQHEQKQKTTKHYSPLVHEPRHLFRCILIVIDMTQSMQIKDFKPSRLSVTIHMIKNFILKAKDLTPVIKFGLAIVEQELCKILIDFTLKEQRLYDQLDKLKIAEISGSFSLEHTLRTAIYSFEKIDPFYKKELLIVQSSPSTKDYKNIYSTIDEFEKRKIAINIISFVGITRIFKKLTEKCKGKYITASKQEVFEKFIDQISKPPLLVLASIQAQLIKITFCRKQVSDTPVECFCHFKSTRSYYLCGMCHAVLCRQPPSQCCICGSIILLPHHFTKHYAIQKSQ